jgi:hypothetical protein
MDVWTRHSGQDIFLFIYVPSEHYARRHRFTYGAQGLQESVVYKLLSNLAANLSHAEVEQHFEN